MEKPSPVIEPEIETSNPENAHNSNDSSLLAHATSSDPVRTPILSPRASALPLQDKEEYLEQMLKKSHKTNRHNIIPSIFN